MQAIILAAGKSQRFYPFYSFGHKSMVSLLGKPLLQHTLEALKKARFSSVVIVVGKESVIPQKIEQVPGLSVTFVTQEETLGMGNALLMAKAYLEDSFFLLSGYHLDISDFANDMLTKRHHPDEVVLLAKEDTTLEKYGVLEVDKDHVVSLTEKPETSSGQSLRAVAIYLLNKTFLAVLEKTPLEHYHFEKALDAYAKEGKVIYTLAATPAITLKHGWDLLTVKDYLLSKIKRSTGKQVSIAKSAVIEGNVAICDNVRIFENACIKGPCYLGEGVVVGNNAIVRAGVIAEKGVVVGANMELKNSILMDKTTTHTGYIGDSVVGPSSRIAAGFCSANVRFDRKEIQATIQDKTVNTHRVHLGVMVGEKVDIGVNVTTMPGICIGNTVTVGPETTILENVEDDTLIYTKFQNVKKKKHAR